MRSPETPEGVGKETVKVRQLVMDVRQPAPTVGTWGVILQRNWEMA